MSIKAIYKLMRLDKPVGIWLLLWPTLQSFLLASQNIPINWYILSILILGVVIMRSIGCVINDLCDIKFDKQVNRTKYRPLVTQEVSKPCAYIIILIGLVLALLLVLQLPSLCFYLAIIGVALVIVYPLSKRWFVCPQVFLGLAFGLMPSLIAYAAVNSSLEGISEVFLLSVIIWPIAYDTLYAMADKPDDIKLKLHSSAKLFGQYDMQGVVIMYCLWLFLWLIITWQLQSLFLLLALLLVLVLFSPYLKKASTKIPKYCFQAFLFNATIGGIICCSLWIDRLMR